MRPQVWYNVTYHDGTACAECHWCHMHGDVYDWDDAESNHDDDDDHDDDFEYVSFSNPICTACYRRQSLPDELKVGVGL